MENRKQIIEVLKFIPRGVAGFSFILGTVIFVLHQVNRGVGTYLEIGLTFVAIAIIVNSLVFTAIIISSFYYKEHQLDIILRALLMLLNIPILIIYIILTYALN